MSSPAETLSNFLPDTIVGGTTGWIKKIGKMVSAPDQVVVFYDTGGTNPNPRWLVDYPTVMCQVRANPNSYADGFTKIRQVRDKLLGLDSQDVGSDRLVSVTMMGDVAFLNYDDRERPTFSVNFRMIIEPAINSLSNREALPGG